MEFFSEIITEDDFAKLANKPAYNILNFAASFTRKKESFPPENAITTRPYSFIIDFISLIFCPISFI
jgi:hypothetical protein